MLEQQFEEIQLPQAAFQRRSFIPEEQKSPPQPLTEAETYFTEHPRGEKIPVLACFSVHVLYRQYGSWQGRAVWEDAHKIANFRSAIELLYLINSALEMPMGRKKRNRKRQCRYPRQSRNKNTNQLNRPPGLSFYLKSGGFAYLMKLVLVIPDKITYCEKEKLSKIIIKLIKVW